MTNLAAWAGGALGSNSFAYTPAFNAADLNGLGVQSSILSSVTAFDNTGASPDQFMDISAVCTIASNTLAIGAGLSFWLAILQNDGTTYGDGRLVAGTQVAVGTYPGPAWPPLPFVAVQTGTAQTKIIGDVGLITLRPRKFALVCQNNTGFALAASGNAISVAFYKQNLNG